jgi:hypothetical protein
MLQQFHAYLPHSPPRRIKLNAYTPPYYYASLRIIMYLHVVQYWVYMEAPINENDEGPLALCVAFPSVSGF